ncbi:replication factor C subunit 2/4 [Fonticula alba]|uniref:Replication factor C subunit 2/4 n=1 Tax=Fonticula alba TaxID=691883 RepID=A0A058ZB74_FONAL|nr:replication factor C subunit 2/4 [Fonticula alba]KCV70677.1 replication factor C subunit 2/4 [Fonticula alba]|eukprot:XP_009495193.1 replication factor C subunit 2/4 [Fonticula alba]
MSAAMMNPFAASAGASDATSGVFELEKPWLEKYRPQTLDDVVGNNDIIDRLRVIARDGNMPHLLVTGPPGTGKTTCVLALAKTLLGDSFKDAVLELNASDDRGIDVVRNKIRTFAQRRVTLPPGRHKIIILDEADSMTPGAQQALRRIMEKFASTTRFALACNISSRIIEPIQSRCAILRFNRLTDAQMLARMMVVVGEEKVVTTDDGLEAILFSSDGDMRQALNNLQSTHIGFGVVSMENVFKVCDQPHPRRMQTLVERALAGDLDQAHAVIEGFWSDGFAAVDIVTTLFRVIKYMPQDAIPEYTRLEYMREIGLTHANIVEGVATLLQLSGLVARLCKIGMQG